MYAQDVWLEDCGNPWTICMSDTRAITLEAAAIQLARTPVSFRRFLTTYATSVSLYLPCAD